MTVKTEEPVAALRDRIAEVLARADGWEYASGHAFRDMRPSTREHYDKLADAVLAVLPAPADQAGIEHARVIVRRLAAHAVGFQDMLDDTDRDPWARTVSADIAALRTALDELTAPPAPDDQADEAQQPEGEAPCTCADAGDCFAPAGHYADCPQAAEVTG